MAVLAARQKTSLPEAILDAIDSAIFVIGPEGHVVRWNRAAARLTGIPPDRIQGQSFPDTLLYPGNEAQWERQLEAVLSHNSSHCFDIQLKKHDDSPVSVACSCSAIRDGEGKLQYIVATATDSVVGALMDDRAAEFRDVSRFLHSTVAQNLVAISFRLGQLQNAALAPSLKEEVESAAGLIDRCCRDIRVLSSLLTPPVLSGTTLERLIEEQAAFVRDETGVRIVPDLDPVSESLSPEAQLLILTAVQSWIGKGVWSRTSPDITIRLRSPRSGGVVLKMEMTSSPAAEPVGGWSIVRERTHALGGQFSVNRDGDRVVANIRFPGRTAE